MQKQFILLLLATISLSAFTACTKKDEDTNKPLITISSPAADVSVAGTVSITGTVTDESLHELTITVTKDSDNTELFKATPEVHDLTSYNIAETWAPSGIVAETPVTLTVTAEDHHENVASVVVKFKVKP